ncbi:MAG: hypothetical protein ACJ768_09335 [Gaiellaceae bacterium]
MIRSEPVLAGVTVMIAAVAGVLVAFGVHLTDVQTAALVQLAEAGYGLAFLIRAAVTPTVKLTPPAPAATVWTPPKAAPPGGV